MASISRAARPNARSDRKSTRLNSSHVEISYAVFCLKKNKLGWTAVLRQVIRRRFSAEAPIPQRWQDVWFSARSSLCRSVPTWAFFFFNDTATTEIYTLSLHDALPIGPSSPSKIETAPKRSAHAQRASK